MAQILEAWCPNWKLGAQIGQYLGARACAHPLCLVFDPWCRGAHAEWCLVACRVFAPGPTRHEVVVALQHRRQLRILTKLSRRARFCYMLSVGPGGPLDLRDACTPASCGCACRGLVPSCARWCFRPPRCVSDGGRVVTRHTFTFTHVQYPVPTGTNTLIPCDPLCEPRWAGAVRAGCHGFVGSGPFLRRPVCTSPI